MTTTDDLGRVRSENARVASSGSSPAPTATTGRSRSEDVPWRNVALGFIGIVLIGVGLGLVVNSVGDAVWLTLRLLVVVAVICVIGLVVTETRRRRRRRARAEAAQLARRSRESTAEPAVASAVASRTSAGSPAAAAPVPVAEVPVPAPPAVTGPVLAAAAESASELATKVVLADVPAAVARSVARPVASSVARPVAPSVPPPPASAVLPPPMPGLFSAPPTGRPLPPPPPGVVTGLPVSAVAPDAVMPPPPPPPPLPQRASSPLASPVIPTGTVALGRTRAVVSSVAPSVVFRYRKWVLGQMAPGAVFEPLAIEGGLDEWLLLAACGVATLLAWTHEDHDFTHPVDGWVDRLLPAQGVHIRDRQLAIDLVLAAALRAGGIEAPQSDHVRSYAASDLVTAMASIHVGLLRQYCALGRITAERVLADQYGIASAGALGA